MSNPKKRVYRDKVVFYCDKAGDWRWKRTASNGKIVGASTEGYGGYSNCRANFERQFDMNYIVKEDMG